MLRWGQKQKRTDMLSCCYYHLDKVLQDIVFQKFEHSSCTAVIRPLQFAEITEQFINGSLSSTLLVIVVNGGFFFFFSCSWFSVVIHTLIGHNHDSLCHTNNFLQLHLNYTILLFITYLLSCTYVCF